MQFIDHTSAIHRSHISKSDISKSDISKSDIRHLTSYISNMDDDPQQNTNDPSEVSPRVDSSAPTPIQEENKTLQPDQDLQNENMEVHHHSSVHHSKKWKDYLFEFLMLFLAVTAGFIVENMREHYIENKRAEQFSKQLLGDLRLDSLFFENRQHELEFKQKGHDQLFSLLVHQPASSDKEIMEALLPITYAYDLTVTTTTYDQMKASGSLRYIHNEELIAALQNYYDVLLPRCRKVTDASLDYFTRYINPFYLAHMRIQDYDPFNDTLLNKQPQIINRSNQTDQELMNIMGNYRSLLKIQAISMNEPALKKLKEAIVFLKDEYELE